MDATKLVIYIRSLPDFTIKDEIDSYDHMGAVVVDGILQAALNYRTVVKPRVMRILELCPDKKTTSTFLAFAKEEGIKKLILWKDDRKPGYIMSLLGYLKSLDIETVEQLRGWLGDETNKEHFIRDNKGIGAVTAEYFRILTGDQSVKIDRHVKNFLAGADFLPLPDDTAIDLITMAAEEMGVEPSVLDYSIWSYQVSA